MATVSETTRSTRITLGSLTAGPFNVGFRLFDSDGLKVFVNGEASTAYTLTATFVNGYSDTATITLDTAMPTSTVVQIDGALIPGRSDDYVNPDPGLTEKINIELARIWAAISENRMLALRSVRSLEEIPATDGVSGANFAEASAAAAETILARDEVLAIQQTLPQWQSSWLTATVYEFADLVRQNGSTYFCTIPHTSGVFATDLAAMRWEMFAQKGDAGAGIGDVVAANNGSEFNASAFRTNLGLGIGVNVQAYNQLLGAVSGLATPGLMVRLTGSTAAARTMTGSAGITVTNGDGVAGNPTFALAFASQAEAEGGTEATKPLTSQRVAQAILARGDKGRVLIAAASPSGASDYQFTNLNDSAFNRYELELRGVKPGTDAVNLLIRTSPDLGGSPVFSSGASDYSHSSVLLGAGLTVAPNGDNSDSAMSLTGSVGNAAGEEGVTGLVTWWSLASLRPRFIWSLNYDNTSSVLVTSNGVGSRNSAGNIYAVGIFFSSGTLTGGLRLYGIRQ
jgi:hypothetical protein